MSNSAGSAKSRGANRFSNMKKPGKTGRCRRSFRAFGKAWGTVNGWMVFPTKWSMRPNHRRGPIRYRGLPRRFTQLQPCGIIAAAPSSRGRQVRLGGSGLGADPWFRPNPHKFPRTGARKRLKGPGGLLGSATGNWLGRGVVKKASGQNPDRNKKKKTEVPTSACNKLFPPTGDVGGSRGRPAGNRFEGGGTDSERELTHRASFNAPFFDRGPRQIREDTHSRNQAAAAPGRTKNSAKKKSL